MFASKEEMGYDPLITRCADGKSYIYQIGENAEARFFKTLRLIAEYRSLCITGRNTQVWEVMEYDLINQEFIGNHPMVLKDLWLDKGAPTEKKIQEGIYKSIHDFAKSEWDQHPRLKDFCQEMKNALDGENYKRFFVDIECDYQGKTSKSVPPSAHQQLDLFSLPTPPSCPSSRGLGDPSRMVEMQFPVAANYEDRKYIPKRQYRWYTRRSAKPCLIFLPWMTFLLF